MCLDFLVCAFVGLASLNTVASDAGSDFDSSVKILSGFFIGNILLLKLLRTFCLASKRNFWLVFHLYLCNLIF